MSVKLNGIPVRLTYHFPNIGAFRQADSDGMSSQNSNSVIESISSFEIEGIVSYGQSKDHDGSKRIERSDRGGGSERIRSRIFQAWRRPCFSSGASRRKHREKEFSHS